MITDARLNVCVSSFKTWDNFTVPLATVREIVESDDDLVRRLNEMYTDEETGLDTYERDILHDATAKHLGFDHWPYNGDSQATQSAFFEALTRTGWF